MRKFFSSIIRDLVALGVILPRDIIYLVSIFPKSGRESYKDGWDFDLEEYDKISVNLSLFFRDESKGKVHSEGIFEFHDHTSILIARDFEENIIGIGEHIPGFMYRHQY